ncbi:zinc-dependent alcohol dehydrogenase family protein [Bradyrhizobium sp. dw_78]|uniref:zinc-dependent alcohol dehydrogenase family protein n=1 Tax=Bradyrhizobium sp. dw_78 TaxID=2719793 RepID=UPI00201BDFD1|nr:zinc-dependent alcohol dehydrogenase family protein [Bradyrhizobium sp. dw_78]
MLGLLVERPDGPFLSVKLPKPVPQAGEVLVRVHVSGVNPLDTKIRAAAAPHARQPLPAVLGMDLAGTVAAIGPGIARFGVGDKVYAMATGVGGVSGSLAEYAVVDADLLAHMPANLAMREAAALPLVLITAWEGLVDRADVQPGQTVAILGAGGGVGHVASQIAAARGAKVFGVDNAAKGDRIAKLGAIPIDRELPVPQYVAQYAEGRGFDLVYDCVGGASLDAAFQAVGRFGHVVSCLGWGTHALAPLSFKAASYSGVFTLLPLLTGEGRARHGDILHEAAAMIEAGRLKPLLDQTPFAFSPDGVEQAYDAVTSRAGRGKVVVTLVPE